MTFREFNPRPDGNDFEHRGYRACMTCFACPEQYDVYSPSGEQVGYLRLRHGTFRADYPDCGGETVYTAYPRGDGCFEDGERDFFLQEAIESIIAKIEGAPPEKLSAKETQMQISLFALTFLLEEFFLKPEASGALPEDLAKRLTSFMLDKDLISGVNKASTKPLYTQHILDTLLRSAGY